MSVAAYPLVKHYAQGVHQIPAIIVSENRLSHLHYQTITREASIQVFTGVPPDFAHLNRLDGVQYCPESHIFIRRIRFGGAERFGKGTGSDVEPAIAKELPRGVVQRLGPDLETAVAKGGSHRSSQ